MGWQEGWEGILIDDKGVEADREGSGLFFWYAFEAGVDAKIDGASPEQGEAAVIGFLQPRGPQSRCVASLRILRSVPHTEH